MPDAARLLAIDQGTTSSRAIVFDGAGRAQGSDQREIAQHFPQDGWVEHDPEEIWQSTLATCRGALAASGSAAEKIAALGITNQRETTLLWRRDDGAALHRAIVWQDRRTAEACKRLVADGAEREIQARTGLVVDPYFSATKLAWLLDHVAGAREAAERGLLAFGTVDSFLLWRLTGGRVHATDATNASRTQLFNIHTQRLGRRASRAVQDSARAAARGARLGGRFRRRRKNRCSARRCRSAAWPATSRRRWSARRASRPA